MIIANPIYDVVFKYMMEDGKIAKLVLSSIIGENIEKLRFLPQEFIGEKENKRKSRTSLTVYRLDFSAQIKTEEGYKQVIIELQKAKFPTDIMRFRKYLGEQLAKKENTQQVKIKNKLRKVGIPIISIYFLGHKLDYATSPVIKISRQYKDLITNELIETKESFIERLTLDSYVIQIPYLTTQRRNDLEILLSVFDQSNVFNRESHILNIEDKDYPEKYRPIIRKLQKAVLDADIKKRMDLEDGLLDELEDLEREIEDLEERLDSSQREMRKVEQEKEKAEQEKEKAEQEKQKAEQEKQKAEQEKQKAEQEKQKAEQEKQKAEQEKQKAEQENENLKLELEKMRNLLKK
jgi:chemotaxis protein histidine kinase CheA